MKQIEKNTVCYYCYGCGKLEDENFNGFKSCKHFITAVADWQEKYRKELKKSERI